MVLAEHLPPVPQGREEGAGRGRYPLTPRGANTGRGMGSAPTTTRRGPGRGLVQVGVSAGSPPELSAYRTEWTREELERGHRTVPDTDRGPAAWKIGFRRTD